jgi:hypothetical protein
MKNAIRLLLRCRFGPSGAVLFAASVAAVCVVYAAEKPLTPPASKAAPSDLARDLTGSWVLVGEPGKVGEVPTSGGRFKFRTGHHYVLVTVDARTGLVVETFGGSYTVQGDVYAETVDFGREEDAAYMNHTYKFNVKVEGDTMTQLGIGNPWNEVWKRVK